MAFYMPNERSLLDVFEDVMAPRGRFGEFLTNLIPVKAISAVLKGYLKLCEFVFEKCDICFCVRLF